jgi:quinone-modifying oxidoreductase subunit QmoB
MLEPLGYGKFKNVVTAMDLERMAKNGGIVRPSDQRPAAKVAFLLNTKLVEPEDMYKLFCKDEPAPEPPKEEKKDGEPAEKKFVYQDMEAAQHLPISQGVNCVVALKQAGYVADKSEDNLAYIIYDSMIVPGIYERYYKTAQDKPGVMLTKGDIVSIGEDADGSILIHASNTLFGGDIEIKVDLLVLPTGIVPTTAKDPTMNFVYRQGPAFPDLELFQGYADSNYICFPYETRRTGVYAAGCVRQPMLMDQAEEDAAGAVLKAIQCMTSANRGVAVHPRAGDLSFPVFNFTRCTQCKRCTEECPFGALDDDEKGTPKPNPTRCRRCGTCMGACPERVISFDTYGIGMMSEMIRQYSVPDNIKTGGPRVLILACENDAYPAMDMAAMRGKKWSPYVRIMTVRCLGSVNAVWIKDAMSRGTDGVMLLGCKYGDTYQCHFVKGSEICNRRKENIAETLKQLGIEPERVDQFEVAIDDYDTISEKIDSFVEMILAKGPNPFKGY